MATITGSDASETIEGTVQGDGIQDKGGDDWVHAGWGNDYLYDGTGNDHLYGGGDNDTFLTTDHSGNDIMDGGWGIDTLDYSSTAGGVMVDLFLEYASDMNYAAGVIGEDEVYGFEKVIGSKFADNLNGSDSDIWGLGGDDMLDGREGNDTIDGFGGEDQLQGGAGNDRVHGGWGDDRVFGGTQDDKLYGDEGQDTLYGTTGKDQLDGGEGIDKLYGGSWSDGDRFAFDDGDSGVGAGHRDQIMDFEVSLDKLDLGEIDAKAGVQGDQAFTMIGSDFWQEGQMRVIGEGGNKVVQLNTWGNSGADYEIELKGTMPISYHDFYL